MRKLLAIFPLSALSLMVSAALVWADDNSKPADIDNPVNDPSLTSVGGIMTKLVPTILVVAGMVAVFFIIWGGFRYMTAQGDPKAIDSARGTITQAIVGLVIILIVGVLVGLIGAVLRVNILTGAPL